MEIKIPDETTPPPPPAPPREQLPPAPVKAVDTTPASIATSRADLRHRLNTATAGCDVPLAAVDMDAWDVNADDLTRQSNGKPIRVVSAAIRHRALLRDLLARDGYAGVLSFSLAEAIWLTGTGICDDALVAYPSADRRAIGRLVNDEHLASRVTIMVDDVAHLDLVDAVAAPEARAELRVCLDLDCSWQTLGGRLRFGARRSPLRTAQEVARLARAVAARPGFRLVGLMAYESQPTDDLWRARRGRIRRRLARQTQRRARQALAERRAAVTDAVRDVADLEFVNAGGSGSLERIAAESCVTEVSAGAGLLGPIQMDAAEFAPRPAAFFALPVVRRPSPDVVTVAGGGYVASGTAGEHQLPKPWLPEGLHLDPHEGAGQTQTPLLGPTAGSLAIGDLVWFRHAKAGELAERFDSYHLVRGERLVDTQPTYRGDGKTFM